MRIHVPDGKMRDEIGVTSFRPYIDGIIGTIEVVTLVKDRITSVS